MSTKTYPTDKMTHRQRLEACLSGAPLDRPPVALWRHFPVDDQSAAGLAAATINFQQTFDFDFVKVTPSSSYCVAGWGVEDEWCGSAEGTREYTRRVIRHPGDWLQLKPLDPRQGRLGDQLACLKQIIGELGPQTPVIQTIFSPLAQAKNLAGNETLLAHLRRYPDAVHAALRIITESIQRFIEAMQNIGIAGIFYAVQHAQYHLLSEEEYGTFGRPYDLEALQPAAGFWFNMLHLHGVEVMFDLFVDYPIAAINWHDRETTPSLKEGRTRFKGVVCGGLRQWQTMTFGSQDEVLQEATEAIQATEGKRFILGTGCVTPIIAPYGNILAVREAVTKV